MNGKMKNMSKQLKDYLHLYLGCEVEYDGIVNGKELKAEKEANKHDVFYIPQVKEITGKKRGFLRRIDVRMDGSLSKVMVGRKGLKSFWGNPDFKLILRPLSDMTDEEKQVIENMSKIYKGERILPSYEFSKRWAADQTRYLLSKHFDLFGLIEAGLAIDKTKVSVK